MEIYGSKDRSSGANMILGNGEFQYRLEPHWAKWPEHLVGCTVACSCTDQAGNVYVTTRGTGGGPVVIFSPDGTFVKVIGEGLFSDNLHGIFYTPRDTLLCADADRHVVREIDLKGKLIRDFGQLDTPSDSGYEPDVFAWLKKQGKITDNLKFSAKFGFLAGFETITHAAGPFNKPTRMIEAPDGAFYATDGYGNAAVHKFASDGTYLKTWGGPGRERGQFRLPHSLLLDARNRLWIADRENSRVHIFSTDGELLHMIEDLIFRPSDIWSDGSYIYVAERDGGMTILDMDLKIVSQMGYFASPLVAHGMTGDNRGNLFIQTMFSHKRYNLIRLVRI